MLENCCTLKAQSSQVGCSQRGHKFTDLVYLAVKKVPNGHWEVYSNHTVRPFALCLVHISYIL